MQPRQYKEKGAALLTALFIMTLVAIAATAMSLRLRMDIYRTQLTLQMDKATLAAEVVTFWAMSSLKNKKLLLNKSLFKNSQKVLETPKSLQTITPGFVTTGSLTDLQGKFNLNNLIEKNYYPIFLKLLEQRLPDMKAAERLEILDATVRWLSPYTPGHGNDAWMSYYQKQHPPYYPSHQLLQQVSEFRLIRGVSAKIYQALSDVITALPETTPINVNTASKTLLFALSNASNAADFDEVMQIRKKEGFFDRNMAAVLFQKLHLRPELVTFESAYFMSEGSVQGANTTLTNYSVLKRQVDKKGALIVRLISESLNTP